MSDSQMFFVRQAMYDAKPERKNPFASVQAQLATMGAKTLEYFLATGLGSRGGPNKVSNKLKRCPSSYMSLSKALELFLATGLGSRGGPNKASNKLKRCPSSYSYS